MKICSRCNSEKPPLDFNRKGAGFSAYCKQCNKDYLKSHYRKNTDFYKQKRKIQKESYRDFIESCKAGRVCFDCKQIFHPCALEFDHLPEYEKEFEIGKANSKGKDSILSEIAKCELVCRNCHAYRTYERRTGINPRGVGQW